MNKKLITSTKANFPRLHARQQKWLEKYNAARKLRYKSDAAYRESCRNRAIDYDHRQRADTTEALLYRKTLLSRAANIVTITAWSKQRFCPKRNAVVACINVGEMARLLERSRITVMQWLEKGFILPPDLDVVNERGGPFGAYSLARAQKVARAVAKVVIGPVGQLRANQRKEMIQLQQ
jgi:hypothetical protein